MNVRKYTSGLAASALLASGLALSALAPASAEPTFTPDANDIVGVGSDTIEIVMNDLAAGKVIDGVKVNGWNDLNGAAGQQRLASFDATGTSPVVLREGTAAVTRPNGSGSGKATLFGAGNNPNINFARSSSTLNNAEQAELKQFAFAIDGLKLAVSGSVATHAPASISAATMVKIYDGTYKTWGDIPGYTGAFASSFIKPFTPQPGSGTRGFFDSELRAANGGVAVVYATASGAYPGVQQNQEHDPSQVQNDPDAISPFSTARAQILANPGAIDLLGGYAAKRAVYNVVRNADAGTPWVASLFGSDGFLCSAGAKKIIEADGLEQLATPANGGVCGVAGTAAVSNFTSNTVATTTTLTATAPVGRQVNLSAVVAAEGQNADGDVEFFEGSTKVGTGLLTGGRATVTLSNVMPGQHTYTAAFVSANPASFGSSTSTAVTVTVKEASTTTVAVVPGAFGRTGTVTVTVASPAGTTGNVTAQVGGTNLGTKATSAGKAVFALPLNLTAGAKTASATYLGNAEVAGSTGAKAFTRAKGAVTLSETVPATIAAGKRGTGLVKVALSPASTIKPTGSVVVKLGSKVVGKGTLVNGQVKITLAKLTKGKKTLTIVYAGTANTLAKSQTFKVTQK